MWSKIKLKRPPALIDMIMLIHVEDKKIILEENLAKKINLIGEIIEQDLVKDLRCLTLIHSYKTSPFHTVTSQIRKKMKQGEFQVSSTIDE